MSKSKKSVTMDTSAMTNYLNYLKNYDTTNVDNTLKNLTTWASDYSQNLGNLMGDYTFNINASDKARQQAQDATYQAYVDKLTPQFERQTSDMQSRLANQGISVGSEAYQRAMGDLQDNQNEALNQAGYQSVLAGQQAYSQDLANQINAGNFGNQAQQAYINQLLSALQGSASGYENQQNIYGVGTSLAQANYNNALAKAAAKGGGLGSTIGSLGESFIKGDVNFNGELDAEDYKIICDISTLQQTPSFTVALAGDMNEDGAIDGLDVIILDLFINNIGPSTIKGDTDGNGKVNEDDYTLLVEIVTLNTEITDIYMFDRCDLNYDGAVDSFDAVYLDLALNGLVAII